jgi:Acetyltransferase (GNAT) domain
VTDEGKRFPCIAAIPFAGNLILGYFAGMNSSHSALEIRAAVRSDVAEIIRVRREAILAKAASYYDPVTLSDWANAGDAGRIAKQISDPDYRVLIAETAGEIIGFAMVAISKQELRALYAKPNPIGNVGTALLAAIEALAFQAVPFLVCDASLNAESFYKAHGYIEECRKERVSSSGDMVSRVVQMKKQRPRNPGP